MSKLSAKTLLSCTALGLCLIGLEASAATKSKAVKTTRPAATDGATPSAPLTVAPLAPKIRTLKNGLKVITLKDDKTATVSVQVWYDVGSKDDPKGRSGFAHLFEHLMFKATQNLPNETYDRLTEDVGGMNNASTADDFTNYFAVVPAHHVERILFAEADRMGTLVVDQGNFVSERDVVKEELRQRVLASPYGKLFALAMPAANYQTHPYGRPGIGSIEDLDSASIDDVRAFHAAFYRPDNAILVVVGNFDQAKLDATIDRYFAPIKTPARPIVRVNAVEPERKVTTSYTVYDDNAPLPAVVISAQTVNARHPDFAALKVLDAILATGDHSRLHDSLIEKKRLATAVFSSFDGTKDASTFSVAAILSKGKGAQDGLKALNDELSKASSVTTAEVEEAKNEIVFQTLSQRETAMGKAFALAQAALINGDANEANTFLDKIQKVTPADVARVAKTYFGVNRQVRISYLPKTKTSPKGDTLEVSKTIAAQTISLPVSEIPVYSLRPAAERVAPPAPLAAISPTLPAPVEKTLKNGVRVIVAQNKALPLVTASLRVDGGEANAPAGLDGLANLTADLLTKGTKTHSAQDIARELESLGGNVSASAGSESTSVNLSIRSDRIDQGFGRVVDSVLNANFPKDQFDISHSSFKDGLEVNLKTPGQLGGQVMSRLLYGQNGYGRIATGTKQSLDRLTPAAAKAFHDSIFRPQKAVVVFAGDIEPDHAFALAEKTLGGWKATGPEAPAAKIEASATAKTVIVDMPSTGQAAVSFGLIAPSRTSADYYATQVTNAVLGGGYSARLNQEIRIKRGLSYGAGASFAARRQGGQIVAAAQTKPTSAPEVAGLIQTELKRLSTEAVGAEELTARKASLIGGFGRSIEINAGIAGQLGDLAGLGLPLSDLGQYVARIDAISPDTVKATASKIFDPAKAQVVIVGKAADFADKIKAERPDTVVISAEALNLDKPGLK